MAPDVWVFDRRNCEAVFGDTAAFVQLFRSKTEDCSQDALISAVRDQQPDLAEEGQTDSIESPDAPQQGGERGVGS